MPGALESLEEENITVDFLRHSLIAMRGFTREAQVHPLRAFIDHRDCPSSFQENTINHEDRSR